MASLIVCGRRAGDVALHRVPSRPYAGVELFTASDVTSRLAQRSGAHGRWAGRQIVHLGPGEESQEVTAPAGLQAALDLVLRVRRGGVLWLSPPCKTFVFASISKSRRTPARPRGNCKDPWVRRGNVVALRCAWLAAVASLRGVRVFVENPAGSRLFWLPCMRTLQRSLGLQRHVASMCRFAPRGAAPAETHRKDLAVLGTALPALLRVVCNHGAGAHRALMQRTEGANGRVHISGGPELTSSAVYPHGFAAFLLEHTQHAKV